MASQPLDIVRAALSTSPRDYEYLDLGDTSGWPDGERRRAADELIRAGEKGDQRAPAALWGLLPLKDLRAAFEHLLSVAPPAVRAEAGWQLLTKLQSELETAFGDSLRDGQLVGHAQTRAIDLLLAAGDAKALRGILQDTTHEDVGTAIIERMWDRSGLASYPTVMWAGLGLVKWQLSLPFASFRQPLLGTLGSLLDGMPPSALGFAPASGPMPPELSAAIADVDSGHGPIPDAVLAPLDEEKRKALLVYAADEAMRQQNARALAYVDKLGAGAHDDVLTWAAAHPQTSFAQAARSLLAQKP
jgi:hypothetical protein